MTTFFQFFQALEDEFAFQLEEQERHYGPYLNSALSAEAAAAEGRNSATPTQRRGSQPSRKASSKSSGSERSTESSSRKSSMNVDSPTKYGSGAGHRHSVATPTSHVNHHHHLFTLTLTIVAITILRKCQISVFFDLLSNLYLDLNSQPEIQILN